MYTLDELLMRRLDGWDGDEWLFLTIGQHLSFLNEYPRLRRSDDYSGVSELNIIVVTPKHSLTEAWKEIDKLTDCKVRNLGIWVLGHPSVKELIFCGRKQPKFYNMCLSQDWQDVVDQLARAV